MTTRYDDDVVTWAYEQAKLLRAGHWDLLDIEHLADEIEDVAKVEQRAFANRISELMFSVARPQPHHLLIDNLRARIHSRLRRCPGLRPMLFDPDWISDMWRDALLKAASEGCDVASWMPTCPWTMDEILGQGMPKAI